jgi:outer membrane protein assembly factor BamB
MRNAIKCAFVLFLLFSISAASQVWKLPTFGSIEAKPVFFGDKMAISSYDGTIYYVYSQTGAPFAKAVIKDGAQQLAMGNGMVVAATGDSIMVLDTAGNVLRTMNESIVYGIETGDDIYATTEDGIRAIGYDGNLEWVNSEPGTGPLTAPRLVNGILVYGAGSELVAANASDGVELMRVAVAPFWKSRPAVYNNVAYIGSTDGRAYAVDMARGKIIWSFGTGGWIMSDPIYNRGTVYVGSNDGYLYALDATNGRMVWKRKVGDAIEGSMEIASLGGKELVLFGSNDNRVYGVDTAGGNITLVFSTGGWVHNPTYQNGKIYFGSYDTSYYSYAPDRACSIDSPAPGENVGYLPFNVSGRLFSTYPGAAVSVRINNLTWQSAAAQGNDWSLLLDPNDYDFGKVFIECRVSDSAGSESQGFTYLVLLRDVTAPKDTMIVESPLSVTQGVQFAIRAMGQDGAPLDSFKVVVAGQNFAGSNGSALVNISAPGTYNMSVRKAGYVDYNASLSVGYDISVMVAGAFVVAAIIGVAYYLFVYKRR